MIENLESPVVNQERVALWADALEDPFLVQGSGRLAVWTKTSDGLTILEQCCLDVACQVALANGIENLREDTQTLETGEVVRVYKWDVPAGDDEGFDAFEAKEGNMLPDPVRAWFGFEDIDPVLLLNHELLAPTITASEANDEQEWPFTKIAKAIRFTWLNGGPYLSEGGDVYGDI